MTKVDEKIARLKETAARKVAESKASQRAVATPDRQLKLELWPEEVRGVPNAALRTAMFTAGKERVFLKEWTPIASVQGIEISARGERLNQHDLDLWEQLLHLQRLQPLGHASSSQRMPCSRRWGGQRGGLPMLACTTILVAYSPLRLRCGGSTRVDHLAALW